MMPSSRRGISLPDVIQQLSSWGFLHLDVSEEFLAGILQGGPKDVDHIVDDKETVAEQFVVADGEFRGTMGSDPIVPFHCQFSRFEIVVRVERFRRR